MSALAQDIGRSPRQIVQEFLAEVRDRADGRAADRLMASVVHCHQVAAESPITITRTPSEYVEHVRKMRSEFGDFILTIHDILADGDRVYVRWQQDGHDLVRADGRPGSGRAVVELASAVYRVADGRIVEYWIQVDRLGMQHQLARIDAATDGCGPPS